MSTLTIGMQIHQASTRLGVELVELADEALSAQEDRKYRDAALKGGLFLEGLLLQVLHEVDADPGKRPTLGELIGVVRRTERAPEVLLDRLSEANRIRIRAAHKTPPRFGGLTEGDSLQMLSILALAVGWYVEEFQAENGGSKTTPDLVPVFLSIGGTHRLDQEQFLQRLRAELRGLGVDLRGIQPSEYSDERPFDQIRATVSACRGALIVGLDRFHGYAVFERERSDRENMYLDDFASTAWNQIEGSMASALECPILVLRERRVREEGVFEAQSHRHTIREFDLDVESRGLSEDLREFLAGWVQHIRGLPSETAS